MPPAGAAPAGRPDTCHVIVQASAEEIRRDAEEELSELGLDPREWWSTSHAVSFRVNSGDTERVRARLRQTSFAWTSSGWTVVPPGEPDYLIRALYIEGPHGRQFRITDAPAQQALGTVAADVIEQYGQDLPGAGRPPVIKRAGREGQEHRLDPDGTLHGSGIRDGDWLRVEFPAPAPAPAPATATERGPGGRRTSPDAQLYDRVVAGFDVKGFSLRNARQQRLIQHELDRMLTSAAAAAGLDRDKWDRRGDGDGEVAILPADIDLLSITRRFITELDLLLTDHNEDHVPQTQIRLRVAMVSGTVILSDSPLGHGGQALIDLARLLGCPPLRETLTGDPESNLAQIVSESLFQRAVVPELGGMRRGQFREVSVDIPEKNFRQDAYIYVPRR